jgi:4-carboxymuconolactone decarboxylase
MMNRQADTQQTLKGLSEGDRPLMDTVLHMTEGSFEESGLDPQSFMLVRLAALATLDAAPASWLVNMKVSGSAGLPPEKLLGAIIAIAPVIGTARVVSAAGNILRALNLADAISEHS